MVACVPCFVMPLLLFLFHRYIQPLLLRVWNPWAKPLDQAPPCEFNCECAWMKPKAPKPVLPPGDNDSLPVDE